MEAHHRLEPASRNDEYGTVLGSTPPSFRELRHKRAVAVVLLVTFLKSFAEYMAASTYLSLIRSLACAEYYALHLRSITGPIECHLEVVEERTSSVIAYSTTLGSMASCAAAITLCPFLIRAIGHKGAMMYGALGGVFAQVTLAFIAMNAQGSPQHTHAGRWAINPSLALRFITIRPIILALLGSSTLLEMTASAVILGSVPSHIRSIWIARSSSCFWAGLCLGSFALQTLRLDTRSQLAVDALPIKVAAMVSVLNLLVTLGTPSFNTSRDSDSNMPSTHTDHDSGTQNRSLFSQQRLSDKLKHIAFTTMRPLRLLFEPRSNGPGQSADWNLSRVIIATMLTSEIATAVNIAILYSQFQFRKDPKDIGLLIGGLGVVQWVYLSFCFPRLATWARQHFATRAMSSIATPDYGTLERRSEENCHLDNSTTASAAADRLLTVLALLLDVISWIVLALAGRAANFALFAFGLVIYAMSTSGGDTITSLASMLLPEDATTEELVTANSFLGGVASTLGPMLSARLYGVGIRAHVPELAFGFTFVVSSCAMLLVASINLASRA